MIWRVVVFALFATATSGQVITGDNNTFRIGPAPDVRREFREIVSSAPAAVLRGLDKLTGVAVDLEAKVDEPLTYGRLSIRMLDCRYPRQNPTGDAYAYLTISDRGTSEPIFEGWMVASSPALIALDHPRYDI